MLSDTDALRQFGPWWLCPHNHQGPSPFSCIPDAGRSSGCFAVTETRHGWTDHAGSRLIGAGQRQCGGGGGPDREWTARLTRAGPLVPSSSAARTSATMVLSSADVIPCRRVLGGVGRYRLPCLGSGMCVFGVLVSQPDLPVWVMAVTRT